MKASKIIRGVLAAELVLLVPLVVMMFTDEVDWGLADFIIIGVLLAGVGFAYQLIVNGVKSNPRQAAIGIALAGLMILIWIHLAVGIVDDAPFAGS